MGFTPTYAWPYPELTDIPDGAGQMKALAEAIDTSLGGLDSEVGTNTTAIAGNTTSIQGLSARLLTGLSTARPTPVAGAQLFETDTNRIMLGVRIASVNYWVPLPGAAVYAIRQTTSQNVPEGAVGAALQFQAIDYDPFGLGITSATRFMPTFPGRFLMTGGVGFASNQTNYRACQWVKKAAVVSGTYANAAAATQAGVSLSARPAVISFDGTTDYVELWGIASLSPTGGTLATSVGAVNQSTMNAVYLGP